MTFSELHNLWERENNKRRLLSKRNLDKVQKSKKSSSEKQNKLQFNSFDFKIFFSIEIARCICDLIELNKNQIMNQAFWEPISLK